MIPVIYTNGASCKGCVEMKKWLNENNVPYEELGIQEAIDAGYRSVPVLEYRGEVVIGFNAETKKRLEGMFPE